MARMTSGGDYGWRRRSRKAGRPGSTSERTRIEPGNCGRPDVFQGSRKGGIVRLSVEPKTQPKIEDDRSIVPAFYAAPRGDFIHRSRPGHRGQTQSPGASVATIGGPI